MPATIQIPKDVFARLRPATDGTPVQGILFGQREETLDRRLLIHVKGFFPYQSSSQDLISTIAKLMNWRDQTVLGWFAAPGPEVLAHCSNPRIASSYFRTIQSSMLKVIVANYLKLHTEYDVREITPSIARESCALFQDLIGIIVQKVPKITDSVNPIAIEDTTAQCYFSAPNLSEVMNLLQNLNRDVKGDIVGMSILQGLADVLPTGVNGLGINGGTTNFVSLMDDREDDDEVGELFSIYGNGHGSSNKKSRTRRASTTDIVDGLPRRMSYSTTSEDVVEENGRKRKGVDTENYGRNASKRVKTPSNEVTNVIPAPFMIIPGQGSEYLHEAFGEDSLHCSTDFDESLTSSFTTSLFNPINELNISRAMSAISHHLITCTEEKISLYEKSCREYEMLLEILEVLDGVDDEAALYNKLESWIENADDDDGEEVITATNTVKVELYAGNDHEQEASAKKSTTVTWCENEISNDDSLSNSNEVVSGEVSSSSIEEGEIDEEEIDNTIPQVSDNDEDGEDVIKKKEEKLLPSLHIKNTSFNNLENNSPGWAWDEEEIGNEG
ncbi:6297_t:CDS:2 [Diversispora eburnea]|uniref:6297_t:CDS:1 n=1 Tax=Diversispora eburnea TaxID=1213867 RepID=A0A9N8YI91_9GLOM|nr:6297_t:CDS:2 [Diversispora eburnea]